MIIFYDGNCPLCAKEMQSLKRADKENKITLEDINKDDFEQPSFVPFAIIGVLFVLGLIGILVLLVNLAL